MIQSELTERFDAEYPIMNAGMGRVALGDLAGAIASEGGIGVIGATGLDPEDLESEIETFYEWAPDGPLVVDLLFPIRAVESADDLPKPQHIPAPVKTLHEELEERGADIRDFDELPPDRIPAPIQEKERALLETAGEMGADALATAVGAPEWAIREAHDYGMDVIALAGRPRHAIYAEEAGADMVVADGTEGGGHSGPIGTLDLIPMVQDVVDMPVIAAGGISRGSQILATAACGAVGVWIGTRFIPTKEADAPEEHKRRIVEAEDDATVRSELADGWSLRMVKNRFTEVWEGHEDEIMDFPEQAILTTPSRVAADELLESGEFTEEEAAEYELFPAGQGSSLIEETEEYPSATEVMRGLIEGTEGAYEALTASWEVEIEPEVDADD